MKRLPSLKSILVVGSGFLCICTLGIIVTFQSKYDDSEPEITQSKEHQAQIDSIETHSLTTNHKLSAADTPEPIDAAIDKAPAARESRPSQVNVSSLSQFNDALSDVAGKFNYTMTPLIDKLEEDPDLRREWLDWLITSDDSQVELGTGILLSTIPAADLIAFASDALAYAGAEVKEATVEALAMRRDINVVDSGLRDGVVSVVTDSTASRYPRMWAMDVLTQQADVYSESDRSIIATVMKEQLDSEDKGIQSNSINALIKLKSTNQKVEDILLDDLTGQSEARRKVSLYRLDHRLELGLDFTSEAIAAIHYTVLSDLSGGIDFTAEDRKQYMETAAYILGSLQLTETQVHEMQAAGLSYPYLELTEGDEG
ncbi:MAG: hypothetical protein AB8B97_16620 [Granulosicoccus sp.]